MNTIFVFLAEYLVTKFFDWINQNLSKNPVFTKIKNNITLSTQNNELKELLSCSIESAMKNDIIKTLNKEEIRISLELNIDIVFQWIIISNRSIASFADYSDKIIYNGNDDNLRSFYNSLFYQIQANKDNYSTLQNLFILDRIDEVNDKVTASLELIKDIHKVTKILEQKIKYTGEFKIVEEKINSRKLKEARAILASLEKKILEKDDPEETEIYYQLLTDSYFYDTANQSKTIEPLEKLIMYTSNVDKCKKRTLLKYLLERKFEILQNELDIIFTSKQISEIDPAYFDIQINSYIIQNNINIAMNFIKNNKEHITNFPLWICRLYYYQSLINDAKKFIDENEVFFSNIDFDIQMIKINILAAYYLEQAINKMSFQNIKILKDFIQNINDIIEKCEDDLLGKSQMHSILGIIYAILGNPDYSRREYEKSLAFYPRNLNTLKNYPFVLINSKLREDKELALNYIRQYLAECPKDQQIETLYYNSLVFLSPEKAIIELQDYKGNNDNIIPFLIYAYDTIFDFTKAEELINIILLKNNISSSAFFFIALHYETVKNFDLALFYYFKAINVGNGYIEIDRIVDKLLRISIFLKNKEKIKEVIESIEKNYSSDEIIIKFIDLFSSALLFHSDYEKCYKYCFTAIQQNINTKKVYEALFLCYYNTQNFHLAFEIIEKYIRNFGQPSSQLILYIAICCIKIEKIDKAYEIFRVLPNPESVSDFLNQIIFLKQIKKDDESIKMAHRAYLVFPKNKYIMECFIDVAMINKGKNIISEEIMSDLQGCISDYLTYDFPNKILQQFKIDINGEPEDIRRQLSSILPDNREIIKTFDSLNEQRLPISFYKNIINRNTLLVYDFIYNQNNYKIWCFDGNQRDIGCFPVIYIDFGSLICLDNLDLLKTLPETFSEILVHQTIYDELSNFYKSLPQSDEGGFLSKDENGNIHFTKDNIPYNKLYDKSKRIINLINFNNNIKIVGDPLITINSLPPKLLETIKLSKFNLDFNIIQCGYTANIPIMLENMTLRKMFNILDNSPQSFCIIDYLIYLLDSNKITFINYCNCLSNMVKQNYSIIPFNWKVLLHLIERNGYIIDDSITYIFDNLCSNIYNQNYSIIEIISIIFAIWNTIIHNEIKYKWTDYLMDKLIAFINPTLQDMNIIYYAILENIYNMKFQKDFISYFEKYLK